MIRNANKDLYHTGALLDNRTPEEKANDIHFSEIVASANPVVWTEKYPSKVRRFPKMNQNQTNMCGAFALPKSLGIMFSQKYGKFIEFYPPDIYQRRANKTSAGMMLHDMMRIAKEGVTLAQFFKADYYTDADAEKIGIEQWHRDVGKIFAVEGDVIIPNDIETIASVIQTTGKAPIFLTYFTAGEYSKEMPYIVEKSLRIDGSNTLRHFIVGVDTTLYKGVKAIYIEDSAWFGGFSERLLTEDWIKNRVYEVRYTMNFKFSIKTGDRPSYDGQTIVSAQKCLRYDGLFPDNVDLIENLGPLTRKAISLFQQKYKIAVTSNLDLSTKDMLRKLFP